jgi:hypothetical protein
MPGGSKIDPRGSKIDPRRLQNRAKIAQEGQGAAQERPRSAQERPRASQERLKSAPRAPQERPKSAHERCKSAQERPKSHSRAPRGAPERPWGTILRLRSSKEAAFEGDPSRDSVEKRVRNDFSVGVRIVRANADMLKTCKNLWFSYGFYRFSRGRLFFERVSQLERERIEKASKNLQNRPSEGPKSS